MIPVRTPFGGTPMPGHAAAAGGVCSVMPLWQLALYVFVSAAVVFGAMLVLPPWSAWRFKAGVCATAAVVMVVLLHGAA